MISEVILVHGLWFRSWAMEHLGRQLGKADFKVHKFNYATTAKDIDHHAESLLAFSQRSTKGTPHYVAHSMGGLLTLHMLVKHPEMRCGRVVLMGSPLRGSKVARTVSQWPAGTALLGEAEPTLAEGIQEWPHDREIGMIAGTHSLGLGALAGGAQSHGDGTVLAEESHHDDLKDHIEIPSSHTSMLFSAVAAKQVIHFLQTGYFSH